MVGDISQPLTGRSVLRVEDAKFLRGAGRFIDDIELPGLLHTTLSTIPADIPYLFADPALMEHWHQRLSGLQGFRIGINWHGREGIGPFRRRDIPLEFFARIVEVQGVRLISLQKGHGREELAKARDQVSLLGKARHGRLGGFAADDRNGAGCQPLPPLVLAQIEPIRGERFAPAPRALDPAQRQPALVGVGDLLQKAGTAIVKIGIEHDRRRLRIVEHSDGRAVDERQPVLDRLEALRRVFQNNLRCGIQLQFGNFVGHALAQRIRDPLEARNRLLDRAEHLHGGLLERSRELRAGFRGGAGQVSPDLVDRGGQNLWGEGG